MAVTAPAACKQQIVNLAAQARWRPIAGGGPDAPHCCLLSFDDASFDTALFAACAIDLPPTIATSVRKRQAEFFFGRYCARLAIERLAAANAAAVSGDETAPRLLARTQIPFGAAREPVWPAPLIGSITHHRHCAGAVAVPRGRYRGIGIDIENLVDDDTLQALLATAISASELAYLQAQVGPLTLPALATMLFSAKESLYKGAYGTVGRFFDFSVAQLTSIDLERRQLTLTLLEDLAAPFMRGSSWTVHVDLIDDQSLLTSFIW